MARRILRMEALESREVPSTTSPDDTKDEVIVEDGETTSDDTIQTLGDDDETVQTTSVDNDGPDDTDAEVEDTSVPALPPVEFGEGNFDPMPVGSKFVVVSGLRSGEAGIYTFDAEGNLIDTGKLYTPFPGSPSRTTTVRGAVGDVNGDGVPDLAFVNGPGVVTNLRVIDGKTGKDLASARPVYGDFFYGGGNVSIADINGDDKAEVIVTPDIGGGPRVRVFSIATNGTLATKADFFGIDDTTFRGGARATTGDMNGDGSAELIVAAGFGGGSRLAIYDGTLLTTKGTPPKMVADFFALTGDAANLRSGISLSAGDLNGDGFADLVIGTPSGGGPQVIALDGKTVLTDAILATQAPMASFFAFDSRNRNGVRVVVKDADGDGKADIITGTGEGSVTQLRGFTGAGVSDSPNDVAVATFLDPFSKVKNAGFYATGVSVG